MALNGFPDGRIRGNGTVDAVDEHELDTERVTNTGHENRRKQFDISAYRFQGQAFYYQVQQPH